MPKTKLLTILLASLAFLSIIYFYLNSKGTARYRNSLRFDTVKRVQWVLQDFFEAHYRYPATLEEVGIKGDFPFYQTYKIKIKKTACSYLEPYQYTPNSDLSRYEIKYCIPEKAIGQKAGYHIATPAGDKILKLNKKINFKINFNMNFSKVPVYFNKFTAWLGSAVSDATVAIDKAINK